MKPLSSFLQCLPSFSVLFLIIGGSNLSLGGYPFLLALYLTAVYYWIIFRPEALPVWGLFGIGLFYDSLMGYDLGLSSVLLMLSWFVGHYSRPLFLSRHFYFVWGAYCLYSFGYLVLYGLLMGGGFPLFVSWVYGVFLYPSVAWTLSTFHVRLRVYD